LKKEEDQKEENQPTDPQVEATKARLSDIGMNPIIIKRLLSLYTLQKIQIYLDVLAEYKKTNRFIYEFLTKKQAKGADLLEVLKGSFLVKARVSGLILEQSEHGGGGCNSCERLKHEQSTVGLSLPLSPFG